MNKFFGQIFLISLLAIGVNAFAVVSGGDADKNATKTTKPKLDSAITKPVLKPDSCGEPIYPSYSKRNNEQGKVGVQLWINEVGNVVTAKIAVSSGFPALDDGAIAFLSRCKFQPAMKDGVPTAVWYPLYHRWTLADSPDEKPASQGKYSFEDKTQKVTFMIFLKESCSSYVSNFNNSESEDFESLGVKKLTEADVCTCAEARIKTDKYLKPFIDEQEPDIEGTMNADAFRVYFGRKTAAVMFECTAKAIEASINKLDPRKK